MITFDTILFTWDHYSQQLIINIFTLYYSYTPTKRSLSLSAIRRLHEIISYYAKRLRNVFTLINLP